MLLINSDSGPGRGLLATRRGTLLVAIGVAAVAAVVLVVFLQQYRQSVADEGAPVKVLVANGLIASGSAGDTLADRRMFRVEEVRASQVLPGAVTDPAVLRSTIAAQDIVPGQQLKVTDFVAAPGDLRTKISGDERAISIPADEVRTLNGVLRAGDRVDVLVGYNVEKSGIGRPVVKPAMSDLLVLQAPAAGAGSLVLRVPGRDVARVAYAAAHGQIWLVVRPGAGAKDLPQQDIVSLEQALATSKPIPAGG